MSIPSGLARLCVERLEDRITPAPTPPTLPTPVTGANQVELIGQSQNANNQAPSVAVDPVNSNIVVAVWTQSSTTGTTNGQTFLIGGLSTNGGASYSLFLPPGPLTDPTSSPMTPTPYFGQTDATVAFDRLGHFFIVWSEHAQDQHAGAIRIERFDTAGGFASDLGGSTLYQWAAGGTNQADPAVNPTLAVDTNLASYTDPVTGAVTTDPTVNPATGVGPIYVAWNSSFALPGGRTNFNGFNQNDIQIIASSDDGLTWSSPIFATNPGNPTGSSIWATQPRLAVLQGTPSGSNRTSPIVGGTVAVVYNDVNPGVPAGQAPLTNSINVSTLSGGRAASFTDNNVTQIIHAVAPPGGTGPNLTSPTLDSQNVTITDPNFGALANVTVQVNITHPNMANIQVRLLPPGNLNRPAGVVFGTNGDLFVSSQQNNSIVEFNGQTGQFVKIFVPSTANGGLTTPDGLVFGPDNNLYVSSTSTNEVYEYNGTSGALIKIFVTSGSGGLSGPTGLTFGSDGNLYVASSRTNTVLEYNGPNNASPGGFVRTLVTAGAGGLNVPEGIVFGPDGDLYISSTQSNAVLRFTSSGAAAPAPGQAGATYASANLIDPTGLAFGPDGDLYVASGINNNVLRYFGPISTGPGIAPVPGSLLDTFVSTGLGGVSRPNGIVFAPGLTGNLIVTSIGTNSVMRYSGVPGTPQPVSGHSGANFTDPANNGGLSLPQAIVFDPLNATFANSLLVSSFNTNSVNSYNPLTGAFQGAFIPAGGRLNGPTGLALDSANNLYVASKNTSTVTEYSGATGAFVATFVTPGLGGLLNPDALLFDSSGNLLVSSTGGNQVMRYTNAGAQNPGTGQAGAVFVPTTDAANNYTLNKPMGLAIDTVGGANLLLVANSGTNQILAFDLTSGAFVRVFASAANAPFVSPQELTVNATDNTLYVTNSNNTILRFNLATGAYMETLVPANNNSANNGGLSNPNAIAIGPLEGDFYVTSTGTNNVMRFERTTAIPQPSAGNTGATFVIPGGSAISPIVLVNAQTNANNQTNTNIGVTGANMGVAQNGVLAGTTFDQNASRSIHDTSVMAPFIGTFRPEGNLSALDGLTAAQLNGTWTLEVTETVPQGATPPPVEVINNWTLTFTSGMSILHADTPIAQTWQGVTAPAHPLVGTSSSAGSTVDFRGTSTGAYPNASTATATPMRGFGPSPSIAVDNTLGSFSPYQGRIYITFAGNANTVTDQPAVFSSNIYLMASDDGGVTWFNPASPGSPFAELVNDDLTEDYTTGLVTPADNFSQGNRAKFSPSIAVDQSTGALVLSWSDARNDASNARVANYYATSINGGATFAPETFTNRPLQAFNAITFPIDQTPVNLEPIPDNQSTNAGGDLFGFGDHQGLAVSNGHIYAVWSGNFNGGDGNPADPIFMQFGGKLIIIGDTVTIGAGPRVISSSEGPVTTLTATTDSGTTIPFNSTFAADGTQEVNGFEVDFDRPVSIASFTANQIKVQYESPTGAVTLLDPTSFTITPLETTTLYGGAKVGSYTNASGTHRALSSRFLVTFTPPVSADFGVGTYSYSIGPSISDLVGQQFVNAGVKVGTFNQMDQNVNSVRGEAPGAFSSGDVYANPQPLNGPPFQLPYNTTTLPLIVPGPHTVGSFVNGNPVTPDNLVLNGAVNSIDIVFDRNMNPATLVTPAGQLLTVGAGPLLNMVGPIGQFQGTYRIDPDPNPGYQRLINGVPTTAADPDPTHPRTYKITFVASQNGAVGGQIPNLSGTYNLSIAPTVASQNGDLLDTNQNAGLFVLQGQNPNVLTTTTVTHTYSGPPVTLTPGKTTSIPLNFPEQFVIRQNTTLELNITYPHDPDLAAVLVAPDGSQVKLFTNVGNNGTKANFTNTIFSDTATTPIELGVAPFNSSNLGAFNPQTPLSGLLGKGSAGTYQLLIANSSASTTGTLNSWSLNLQEAVPGTGLGEAVADQATVSFRIFTQNPSNTLSHTTWTGVGPAAIDGSTEGTNGFTSGAVTAIAVDPSDPSGNTVYIGASAGGVWKTTNFLTKSPSGPTWVPLTDFGPTYAVHIGSIAIFPRNNDPKQSIIFAATGNGNEGSQGIGILRSTNGGATWTLLDSTNNVDAQGNLLAINSAGRDHIFAANGGTTAFKIVVDPTPAPTSPNNAIVYVAFSSASGGAGGLWRSLDSGNHWQLMSTPSADGTQCTDVVLAPSSVSQATGNLQVVYAAFEGFGVFQSQAQGASLTLMPGQIGNTLIRNPIPAPGGSAIPVTTPAADTPNGAKGRIVLSTPNLTGVPTEDLTYQGWVYAAVATPAGTLDGLYLTKDGGQNWTRINLPRYTPFGAGVLEAFGTNDETQPNYDPVSSRTFANTANLDMTLTVDPTNPSVVYLGGTDDLQYQPLGGLIRIDTTKMLDAHALVPFDNDDSDGGALQTSTVGALTFAPNQHNVGVSTGVVQQLPDGSGSVTTIFPTTDQYFTDLIADPYSPFLRNATILATSAGSFNNLGEDSSYASYLPILQGTSSLYTVFTMKDPLTGRSRLIYGDANGVYTGVDQGNGQLLQSLGGVADLGQATGNTPVVTGSRVGNLQITQFFYGAAQPSVLAAAVAANIPGSGGLFYGNSWNNSFPVSDPNILSNGNLNWLTPSTLNITPSEANNVSQSGTGVATDQTGTGTAYSFQWPCCGQFSALAPTNFFLVNNQGGGYVSRTGTGNTSLVQQNGPGLVPDPQWPYQTITGGPLNQPIGIPSSQVPGVGIGNNTPNSNFAVNPINGNDIIIGSAAGRIFKSNTQGRTWFQVGFVSGDNGATATNTLDGTYAPALAYGAPDPANPLGHSDDFFYVGTSGGHVYVTLDGGGHFTDITGSATTGLNGSPVVGISADTLRGSHDVYVETTTGVFHLFFTAQYPTGAPPVFVGSGPGGAPSWIRLTGNLFNITTKFGQANNPLSFQLTVDPTQPATAAQKPLQYLTSMAVDWRYQIPDNNPANPTKFLPAVYVGGNAGVYRLIQSTTNTALNWTLFPDVADDGAPVDGGLLPAAHITSLSLDVGNINPATGQPDQSGGPNLLLATTYGMGEYAIRLPINNPFQFSSGPVVVTVTPSTPVVSFNSITVTFGEVVSGKLIATAVDPSSVSLASIDLFTGPNGPITATAIKDVTPTPPPGQLNFHNVYEIDFSNQSTDGTYTLAIGPNIRDFAGSPMNQNGNMVNGEPFVSVQQPGDAFVGTFVVVNSSDNAIFVTGMYHDLLNRPADAPSLNSFRTVLDNARSPLLPAFANNFLLGNEYRTNLASNYYQHFLGRSASPGEASFWAGQLAHITDEQFAATLVGSTEFFQRAGTTNLQWLNAAYQTILGRLPDNAAINASLTALQNGTATYTSLAFSLLTSTEYRNNLVGGFYTTYLKRPASSQDLAAWNQALSQGTTDEQVINSLVSSQEYFTKPTLGANNSQTWLSSMYTNVLNRTADSAGLQANLQGLLSGYEPPRQSEATTIITSAERFGLFVSSSYMTYLGRSASSGEISSAVASLQRGTTDEQFIASLVGSNEFFANHGGTNNLWASAAVSAILGRPADTASINYVLSVLAATGSRVQAAFALTQTTEYRNNLVIGYYHTLLGRTGTIPPDQVSVWVQQLQAGLTDEMVMASFVGSNEYFLKPHQFP
jgi:sugar lactone lactonase YvrE/subtilisin-like proprotein convertase family protein